MEVTGLDVHYFNGEEYKEVKRYLEKRGCTWSEERGNEGELLSIHLDFPPETVVRELDSTEVYKRHQVIFPNDSGFMYWSMERATKKNRVSVPYVYL